MSVTSIPVQTVHKLQTRMPAILLLGGALNGFVVRVIESWHLSGASAIFFGISPFELITIAVAAILYTETTKPSEFNAGPAELLFLTALLLPSSSASWLATLCYAIFHAMRSRNNERCATLLFAALSACSIWSSILMKWIAVPVTNFEASLIWHSVSLFRSDLILDGNIIGIPDSHRIVLLIACTTAYGLPKAALGFMAITLFFGNLNPKSIIKGLSATLILYATTNIIRLISMAWSDHVFHIAHGPIGSNIFDATTTAAIFAIAFLTSGVRK